MLMGNAMMLRLIPVYESFFRGDKDRWRRNSSELSYVARKLGRRPWRLSGLHSVRVANSGELSYVACKLGRRPWRLLRLARRANSKTRRLSGLHGVRMAKPGGF